MSRSTRRKKQRQGIRAIDLFCGAGGSSIGARQAGIEIVGALDYWRLARKTFVENFPSARFFGGKIENWSAKEVARQVGRIDLILASPECTNHTCARGSRKRSEASRSTAFQVVRFAKALKPRWIVIENVVHMRSWKKYKGWLERLRGLGYKVAEQMLNAADFGVPQSRRRLFVLCDLTLKPPKISGRNTKRRAVKRLLNMNGLYRFSHLKKAGRAKPTLQRARRAIRSVGRHSPFLLVYYGSDAAGGWQGLNRPLRTITTVDRFALVKPRASSHVMRMLQVDELRKAMGFPSEYKLQHGTRRDRIKLLGNAVCPPVMRAILRSLTTDKRETNGG